MEQFWKEFSPRFEHFTHPRTLNWSPRIHRGLLKCSRGVTQQKPPGAPGSRPVFLKKHPSLPEQCAQKPSKRVLMWTSRPTDDQAAPHAEPTSTSKDLRRAPGLPGRRNVAVEAAAEARVAYRKTPGPLQSSSRPSGKPGPTDLIQYWLCIFPGIQSNEVLDL